MFYRIVNARYKDRQYIYLKLLESQRQGDKIRHRQIASLSSISQLPAEAIRPLFDDLTKSIVLYREIADTLPLSCSHPRMSYLLALENSFKLTGQKQCADLWEPPHTVRRTKKNPPGEDSLFNLIYRKARDYGLSPDLIGWVEKMETHESTNGDLVCFLLDGRGLPLKYIALDSEKVKEKKQIQMLSVNNRKPEFFLAPSCERLYNNLGIQGLSEEEKGNSFKEVFVLTRDGGTGGNPGPDMEKMCLYGPDSALREENIRRALVAVSDLKNHLSYVRERLSTQLKDPSLQVKDLVCTYFMSLFFKKIFDLILTRNNIRNYTLSPDIERSCKQ